MSGNNPFAGPNGARLHQLWRELYQSPGDRLLGEFVALGLSARTFDVNAIELLRVLETFEGALVNPLMTPGKRQERWEFAFEVIRLFQNAIASGQSFLEHSRRSVERRYQKVDPFFQEFFARYPGSLNGSPICRFMYGVRGYLLHQQSGTP